MGRHKSTFHEFESCRRCGRLVKWAYVVGQLGTMMLDTDMAPHVCEGVKVRIFTDEEKQEFARKRLAGEI